MLNDGDLLRYAFGLALLAAALGLSYHSLDRKRTSHRMLFACLSIGLSVFYIGWRWSETLSFSPFWSFGVLWPLLFACVETSRFLDESHAIYTLGHTTDRIPQADAGEARLRAMGADVPQVDVFITTYDEPEAVILRTILGAQALDYPYFRVFVLDDGARPWLEKLCIDRNVNYIARSNGTHAKAGNLNNGLAVTRNLSPAPFILLLDADFIPFRNFLWRTLGFFEDPQIAIVQTPQFYFNPDPLQLNLGTPWSIGDEQRFFFDVFQSSKDAFNASFCCGSSCVWRRAAIEATGGVPTGSVIEDIHLSYQLLGHGWVTRYLNEILTNGLAPESVREFVGQRVRWAVGCAQCVFMPCGPFSRNGLTLSQRLHYLSPVMFWVHLTFIPLQILAPAIYWITGVPALDATLPGWMNVLIPRIMVCSAFMHWVGDGKFVPFWKTLNLVYAVDTTISLVILFTTGRIRATRTTQKGLVGPYRATDRHLLVILGTFLAVNLGALWWGLFSNMSMVTFSAANELNACWSIYSMVVVAISMTACIEVPRHRQDERFQLRETIDVEGQGEAALIDISVRGAKIVTPNAPDPARLRWRGLPPIVARRVRQAGNIASYQFDIDQEMLHRLTTEIYTSGLRAGSERARIGPFLRNLGSRFILRSGVGR